MLALPRLCRFLLLLALAPVHCAGGRPSRPESAPPARPITIPTATAPAGTAPPSANAPDAGLPLAVEDAGSPPSCEGQRHLETPAAGVGNDKAFTVAAASIVGQALGEYASLNLELGSHGDRYKANDAYRGISISVFANAPSLTLQPGHYEIPHWEKDGPIWSAMVQVDHQTSLGNNARGELIIDEITPSKGKMPATVRGKVWICVDPIDDYPGAQWLGGTFTAKVNMTDPLYKLPVPFKIEQGRIVASRSKVQR
jgi:hypothetical protein